MSVLSHYADFATMAPTSWNYGCFNDNSKLQNAYKQSLIKTLMNYQLNKMKATQGQRCSSASNKVADEEYYRAVAQTNQSIKKEREIERQQRLTETFISKQFDLKLGNMIEKHDDVVLPRETLYLIDKIVREKIQKDEITPEMLKNPK